MGVTRSVGGSRYPAPIDVIPAGKWRDSHVWDVWRGAVPQPSGTFFVSSSLSFARISYCVLLRFLELWDCSVPGVRNLLLAACVRTNTFDVMRPTGNESSHSAKASPTNGCSMSVQGTTCTQVRCNSFMCLEFLGRGPLMLSKSSMYQLLQFSDCLLELLQLAVCVVCSSTSKFWSRK